jgi:uroporphyrinogen decarboxylase
LNKKDIMLSLTQPGIEPPYIPASFFLHFDEEFHHGKAAIDKHLEYFHATGMDFIKIQYELKFPAQPISQPNDWSIIPSYGAEFFEDQWRIAEGLAQAADGEILVLMTLYSPFMCAGQIAGDEILNLHINEHPEKVKIGMDTITESMLTFTRGCVEAGIDGFYHSTQGAEKHRFGGSPRFDQCIRPFDLKLMEEINEISTFNILHICDYHGGYDDLSLFLNYPGDIVNCSLEIGNKRLTGHEISNMFGKPFMGGMDRHGIIAAGDEAEIRESVKKLIKTSPKNFILGADCTLPGNIDWKNIKAAIDTAHQFPNLGDSEGYTA